MILYTIGHSTHGIDKFISLLNAHKIQVVVDVRSSPFSRHTPQFNTNEIKAKLEANNIKYLYMGNELGGKPKSLQYYDDEGYVLYGKIADSPQFALGIQRLKQGISQYTVAIMCSEENPAVCHRHLLLARVLTAQGIKVAHLRGDGSVEAVSANVFQNSASLTQTQLFTLEEASTWRSTQSVLHKKPHPDSLGY